MIVLGIDSGITGGLAFLDGERIELLPMPIHPDNSIDVSAAQRWLDHLGTPDLCIIEEQRPRHSQNVTAVATSQRNYGKLLGMLETLEIPHEIVTPQVWQKALGVNRSRPKRPEGETKKQEAKRLNAHRKKCKDAAAAYCRRRYPHARITPESGKGSKSYHDGLSDALCQAEFGRRERE